MTPGMAADMGFLGRYIPCDGNETADLLAKKGTSLYNKQTPPH